MNKKEYQAAYRAAHREEARIYQTSYRKAHKKEEKEHNDAYRATHKEELKVYHAEYYNTHKEYFKEHSAKYESTYKGKVMRRKRNMMLRTRYNILLKTAKKRKHEIDLSLDDYIKLVGFPCFYCGGLLPSTGHGLDRIDSEKGYTIENVHPCCTNCNIAKSSLSETEFKEWVVRIYTHWIKL